MQTVRRTQNICSIRGAITVKKNSIKEITIAVSKLISQILKQNKLDKSKIINIIFTVTDDLDSVNPATIAREEFNLNSVPMLCVQEMKVKNKLPKCIRIMVNTHTKKTKEKIKHVYLGDAAKLRPDLI